MSSTQTLATPANRPDAAQRPRSSFGQPFKRKKAVTKMTMLSPEARRELEENGRRLIAEAMAQGRITHVRARYADGVVFTHD